MSVLNAGAGEGIAPSSAPANLDGANDTLAGGLALTSQPGYRWQERTTGNWIDYDASGKIVSYGDKNNLRVWFEYGAAGEAAQQIQSVRDHFERTVACLHLGGQNVAGWKLSVPSAPQLTNFFIT